MTPLEEELHQLEVKVKQLKLDYEQYFSGSRPREPVQARSEVQKAIIRYQSDPIRNTALRFKFNTINSRFQAFKRQWDNVNRQIEAGTYKRHVFRADLKGRGAGGSAGSVGATAPESGDRKLFDAYREAAASCGQDVSGLTRERLEAVVRKQEAQIKQKLGVEKVDFRVVVQDGKVKLKASAGR